MKDKLLLSDTRAKATIFMSGLKSKIILSILFDVNGYSYQTTVLQPI
jgi:hypothetical protein